MKIRPTVIMLGGIHGNEPAGAFALTRLIADLKETGIEFRGRLVALSGNRGALQQDRRYIERDLNRRWFDQDVRALLDANPDQDGPEDREVYVRHFKKGLAGSNFCTMESETGQEGAQLCKEENPGSGRSSHPGFKQKRL